MKCQWPIEHQLAKIVEHIRSLVDPQSQTDPSFKSTQLYTRLSTAETSRQLIKLKGYKR
ncbi:transposase [Cylindrospermum sp. NIES-4074]|nr:transposase [Cylindrospermum sp. NIES-4074]